VSELIGPEELRSRLDDTTVLDVRWRLGGPPGRLDHLAGHVPGAIFLDIDVDLCGPPGAAGRHPLPDPDRLQTALRAAGVRADRPVVAYDYGDGMAAARTWWTLRWAGHRDVRVLDGGYPVWLDAGLPVEAGSVDAAPGDFTVEPGRMPVLDASGAAAVAGTGTLVDARIGRRFRGEIEPVDAVAGHIPGARNLPYDEITRPGGRLRSADELRARFAEVGIDGGTPTGAYCGSGITAAHTVLAMTVAGVPDPGLYVGSWSNWIAEDGRPIAMGDDS
jgi:thiosulfate/3-mercaptopyruvate sulfurtransferase